MHIKVVFKILTVVYGNHILILLNVHSFEALMVAVGISATREFYSLNEHNI